MTFFSFSYRVNAYKPKISYHFSMKRRRNHILISSYKFQTDIYNTHLQNNTMVACQELKEYHQHAFLSNIGFCFTEDIFR